MGRGIYGPTGGNWVIEKAYTTIALHFVTNGCRYD
jgi:hypothetical protein